MSKKLPAFQRSAVMKIKLNRQASDQRKEKLDAVRQEEWDEWLSTQEGSKFLTTAKRKRQNHFFARQSTRI